MSRNNNLYSKLWAKDTITVDNFSGVQDFMKEAFEGLSDVTFNFDEETKILYIYLDPDKKIYITVEPPSDSTFIIRYNLKSSEGHFHHYVTYNTTNIFLIGYVRTAYGIAWGVKTAGTSIAYTGLNNIYTQKNTPAMFIDIPPYSSNTSNTSFYILSASHEEIETVMERSYGYLSVDDNNGGFAVANAFSLVKNLKLRHLFRVLYIPSTDYPHGRIMIGTKKLFWLGRFALEYEEE